ncbi:MAG: sensor histidine kinase [Acidimicrobiales bacterium]|nr:sensor histidine kinase [Acidimicrobiales bacterium]
MGVDKAEVDLLRRRVLNVVGHELRTPVSTLAGLAEQLVDCDDERLRQEITEGVVRNARRLDRLVDDLLLASSIETVVPVGSSELVDLVDVARQTWDGPPIVSFSGTAQARCRPEVAHRALAALLDNAAKYGEAPVTVTGVTAGAVATVDVASGGPAILDAELELATELFFRGERAVTSHPGLGIGLAVARTLARADGGDVSVRSGNSGGLIARLELPAP